MRATTANIMLMFRSDSEEALERCQKDRGGSRVLHILHETKGGGDCHSGLGRLPLLSAPSQAVCCLPELGKMEKKSKSISPKEKHGRALSLSTAQLSAPPALHRQLQGKRKEKSELKNPCFPCGTINHKTLSLVLWFHVFSHHHPSPRQKKKKKKSN